jgi:hypothetical protein
MTTPFLSETGMHVTNRSLECSYFFSSYFSDSFSLEFAATTLAKKSSCLWRPGGHFVITAMVKQGEPTQKGEFF